MMKFKNKVMLLHERKHQILKPLYSPHGGQTPSYKYLHTVCDGVMSVVHALLLVKWTVCPKFPWCPFLVHGKNVLLRIARWSQDTPNFLKGRTHLSTGQCSREGVVTDGYSLLCVVHIHLLKTGLSNIFWLKRTFSNHLGRNFSPLHVQMLRSPPQLVPLAPKYEDRPPLQRRRRWLCEGSQEAGGQTLGF